jgi:iron complex outermembrane recepter protein
MRVSKHNFMLRRSVAAVMMTLPALYAHPALAQSAGGEKAEGEIDKVIVTARKREELIQDVPGAVTALSGAQLEKKALPDITALSDFVPNTTLKASRGTNTTLTAFIRGSSAASASKTRLPAMSKVSASTWMTSTWPARKAP